MTDHAARINDRLSGGRGDNHRRILLRDLRGKRREIDFGSTLAAGEAEHADQADEHTEGERVKRQHREQNICPKTKIQYGPLVEGALSKPFEGPSRYAPFRINVARNAWNPKGNDVEESRRV